MTFHPADIGILVVFFALSIIVGFKHRGRRLTFRGYAVGNKDFTTAVLTATTVATWMSGSLLFIDIAQTYGQGLYYIVATLVGGTVVLLLIGRVIGPRMEKFLNSVSVPDALGTLYGKPVQIIAGAGLVVKTVGSTALQFAVIFQILEVLFGYSGPELTLMVGTVIILYAASGGARAVTFTDVVQFFTFGALLPVLALVIWSHLEHVSQVTNVFYTHPHFSFGQLTQWSPELMGAIILMVYYIFPGLSPELFQRMVMARDTVQLKRTMTYAAVVCLAVKLCIAFIAVLLLADRPGLASEQLLGYVAERHAYAGLRGLLAAGVVALAMSTADSALNAGAVILANDVVAPLRGQPEGSLSIARWATLIIGFGALALALAVQSFLDIVLFSASFYMPLSTIPMLLAIFGFQTSRRVVLMGMGAGLVALSVCLYCTRSPYSFFPAMLANLAVTLGAHHWLRQQGGWGHNRVPQDYAIMSWLKRRKAALLQLWRFNLHAYLAKNVLRREHYLFYSVFGVYVLLTLIPVFLELPAGGRQHYADVYLTIYLSVSAIAIAFIAHPLWPYSLKQSPLMTYVWPGAILYGLFGAFGMLSILSGLHYANSLILLMNLFMAMMLVEWQLGLALSIVGLLLAWLTFSWGMGVRELPVELEHPTPLPLYGMAVVLVYWVRHKSRDLDYNKKKNKYLDEKQEKLVKDLFKSLRNQEERAKDAEEKGIRPSMEISALCKKAKDRLSGKQDASAVAAAQTLEKISQDTEAVASYLRETFVRTRKHSELTISQFELDKLIKTAKDSLHMDVEGRGCSITYRTETQEKLVQGDERQLCDLLETAIFCIHDNCPENQTIVVTVKDTTLGYPLGTGRERVKIVKALCFSVAIAEVSVTTQDLYRGCMIQAAPEGTPDETVALAVRQKNVLDAHYGTLEWTVTRKHGPVQVFVIPLRVREVRPRTMEDFSVKRVPNPGIDAQEKDFIRAVEKRVVIDPRHLHGALHTIKTRLPQNHQASDAPRYPRSIGVAHMLLDYTTDPDVILTALIRDTVSQTRFSLNQVAFMFNTNVRQMTEGLMRFEDMLDEAKRLQLTAFEVSQQLLSKVDQRILHIELVDCLYSAYELGKNPSDEVQKQRIIKRLRFSVPVAKYLRRPEAEQTLLKTFATVLNTPGMCHDSEAQLLRTYFLDDLL